ncbi:MAG: prenyltransferase [Chloroflexota bacterium]|nr:prenyltransferase [Chloroflexota bacterium]
MYSTDARKYLKISRPKFWLYLLGPYFLGAVLALEDPSQLWSWPFWSLFAWWTFPANLLLYGVNDISDYDTDQHNPKKVRDEALVYPHERPALLGTILLLTGLAVPALVASNTRVVLAFALFLALAVAYSVPPLRLKARPVLDSLSNSLYLTPLLAGWWSFTSDMPLPSLMLAGVLWCAAMHAYSAVPDIESDRRAGLSTIATLLGHEGTLLMCALSYLGAALLVSLHDALAGLLLGVYPLVMTAQLLRARARVSQWYRFFPVLNGLAGMCLTLRFLWPLAR